MAGSRPAVVHGIIGRSAAMRALCRRIEQVAPRDATVLILGERGRARSCVAARDPRGERAGGPAVRRRQLRRAARRAARERALRARARRVHGRVSDARRAVRARRTAARCSSTRSATCRSPSQAKLLRVLQERRGAPSARSRRARVDVRVHRGDRTADLAAAVARGGVPRGSAVPAGGHDVLAVPPLRDAATTSRC